MILNLLATALVLAILGVVLLLIAYLVTTHPYIYMRHHFTRRHECELALSLTKTTLHSVCAYILAV
jgi:hypothetical protein